MDIELLVKNETGNDATLQYLVNENPTIEAAWTTIINKGTNTESTYVFPEKLSLDAEEYSKKENLFYRSTFQEYISDISNENFQIEMVISQWHMKPTVFFAGAFMLLLSLVFFVYWIRDNIKYRNPTVQIVSNE